MAAITQGSLLVSIGQTVYWRPNNTGTWPPCVFKGFISGTQASLIMRSDLRTLDAVETSQLYTTATG